MLFCAAMKRDFVPFLRLHFFSQFSVVRFRLFVTSNVYTLVFFRILFTGYFSSVWYSCWLNCFLSLYSVFFCIFANNAIFDCFYRCIDADFYAGESSPPSFHDTYILSTSSPRYKALCIVMSFLVLRSFCFSSSLVYYKNGPKYFRKGAVQAFILLMRFLLYSLILSSFPHLLKSSILIFSFPSPLVF